MGSGRKLSVSHPPRQPPPDPGQPSFPSRVKGFRAPNPLPRNGERRMSESRNLAWGVEHLPQGGTPAPRRRGAGKAALMKRMDFRGCADVRMCGCADVRMCGCADVRMCGCADARMRGCGCGCASDVARAGMRAIEIAATTSHCRPAPTPKPCNARERPRSTAVRTRRTLPVSMPPGCGGKPLRILVRYARARAAGDQRRRGVRAVLRSTWMTASNCCDIRAVK
jgi:hypothetical protein